MAAEGRSSSDSSIQSYGLRSFSSNGMHLRPRLSLSGYAEMCGGREAQLNLLNRRNFSVMLTDRIIPKWRHQFNGHQEIVDQAKSLCGRYLRVKLRSCATANKKLGLQRLRSMSRVHSASLPSHTQPVVHIVAAQLKVLCRQLEQGHPSLYHSVLGNVGLCSLPNPSSVGNLLHTVAREIFRNDITWGRVVALFCVTGALAADCVRLGHPDFVLVLVESVGTFVDRDLAVWIAQKGGWVDLLSHCHSRSWKTSTLIIAFLGLSVVLLTLTAFVFK